MHVILFISCKNWKNKLAITYLEYDIINEKADNINSIVKDANDFV